MENGISSRVFGEDLLDEVKDKLYFVKYKIFFLRPL